MLGFAPCDRVAGCRGPQQAAVLVVVIATVGDDPRRAGDGVCRARPRTCGIASISGEQLRDVVAVGAGHRPGQEQAAGVGQDVMLDARAGRGRPGSAPSQPPPFSPARRRRRRSRGSSRSHPRPAARSSNITCSRSQTPACLPGAQSPPGRHPAPEAELLRQVLPADPGVQQNRIPCSTGRSSSRCRPG